MDEFDYLKQSENMAALIKCVMTDLNEYLALEILSATDDFCASYKLENSNMNEYHSNIKTLIAEIDVLFSNSYSVHNIPDENTGCRSDKDRRAVSISYIVIRQITKNYD